jgi:lipopolysaccharide export system permease protein
VTAYNAAILLRDAAYARVSAEHAIALILLRNVTAAEVLLPTALYMAVLATVNQWHQQREAWAFYAAGVPPRRLTAPIALLCLAVCIAVAGLSLFARPWAYGEGYRLDRAAAQLTTAAMIPDRFYTFGDVVLSARSVDTSADLMRGVFMEQRDVDEVRVIFAESGRIGAALEDSRRRLELLTGTSYALREGTLADRVSTFSRLVYYAPVDTPEEISNRRRAATTSDLFGVDRPKELAELQWRFILPVTALFLTLAAIEISRSRPGTSPYPRFVAGLVLYAAMFNLAGVARTWLENDLIGAVPGMLWVPLVGAVIWLVLRRVATLSLGRPT